MWGSSPFGHWAANSVRSSVVACSHSTWARPMAVEEELRRVEESHPAVILLDLRELEFMDSTGLRVIVSADGRAREDGRVVRLVRGREAVPRIFRVTRLDERLEIGDHPDALATRASCCSSESRVTLVESRISR